MKRIMKYFLICLISCACLLAVGYGWSQDIVPMQQATTFFRLNQVNQGATLGKMPSQQIKENRMNQLEQQKETQLNYHEQVDQQIQNNIGTSQQNQQDQLDKAHQVK